MLIIGKSILDFESKFNEDFGYEKKPREDSHSFGYKSAFAKVRSDHSAVARLKF